ncbi:MAG: aminopeptidase [Gammaproteobacteria bacterium]|nr:aminopeptidase [Gammaproteobacteria bacterium]MYD76961.1 aminopeptidase [Gammaproteobacteria bacterium]MYJ52678.1 aminopeptidase [Gammaproteobacteria bacterium]
MNSQSPIMSPIRWSVIILCVFMTGCSSLGYIAQATRGQIEIAFARTPIDEILANKGADAETRKRLELVKRIRRFAIDELDLPDNRSYTTYSELGRRYAVWNVVAAPAYSLTLKTWCFPMTGCLAYRGYFSEEKAEAYEQSLAERGYDTDLYGVVAYSTLGWFDDPVLDTFLHYPEHVLAGLIFHELAHQVVYVKDDTAFNEAFATAVEQEGVERWMRKYGDSSRVSEYRRAHERNSRVIGLILNYRNRLAEAYDSTGQDGLASAKGRILGELTAAYESLSQKGEGTEYWDRWFSRELNNARLGSIATYHSLVPAFRDVLSKSESMAGFYAAVAEQSERTAPERHAWLQSHMDEPSLP